MGCKGLGVFVLTALLPLSATAATVTVQYGETLSEIANRYGVSTRQLMRLYGLRTPITSKPAAVLRSPVRG